MSLERARERLATRCSGEVRVDEPMARHTTYRIGGPASLFITMDAVHDVGLVLEVLAEEDVPWTVVGKGSNLLVADAGYQGAVLVLGREFKHHSFESGLAKAGAACVLAVLVQDAFHEGVDGLSWAVGIPGTVGGALAMNAGTRHGWISECVESVTIQEPGRGMRLLLGRDVSWGYRTSGLADSGIILECSLRVSAGEVNRIRAQMERNLNERKASQPMGVRSAGSVFVNPEGDSAGRLIEAAGCKGMRSGGAVVSSVHANFIVNEGGASAADVLRLVRKVQMTVRDTHGVELKPEIGFLGSFEEA